MTDVSINQAFFNGLHLDRVVWGGNIDQRGYMACGLRSHYAAAIHQALEGDASSVIGSAKLVELIRSPWFPAVIESSPAEAIRALDAKINLFSAKDWAFHSSNSANPLINAEKLVSAMAYLASTVRELEDFRQFNTYVAHGSRALDQLIQGQ